MILQNCCLPCACHNPCSSCQLDKDIQDVERQIRFLQDRLYRLKAMRGQRFWPSFPQFPLNPYPLEKRQGEVFPSVDDVTKKIK